MNNATPQPKVIAGGLAGALTVLVVYGLKEFGGIDLPAEVASAFTTLVSGVAAYLTSNE